jgi:hypothetical protein
LNPLKGTAACFAGRGQVGVFSIKTHYKSLQNVPQAGEIGCRSLLTNFYRSPNSIVLSPQPEWLSGKFMAFTAVLVSFSCL